MRYKDTRDWIYIDEESARLLIENVRPDHWKLPTKILYHYGLRVSEVLSLTPQNFRNGEMTLQRFKHGLLTRQFIVPEIREELAELCRQRGPSARLFPYQRKSFWQALQQAAFRCGVDQYVAHPHAFRHACGRRAARKGTINEVQAFLGHRSLQATMMYTQLSCDVELSKRFLMD